MKQRRWLPLAAIASFAACGGTGPGGSTSQTPPPTYEYDESIRPVVDLPSDPSRVAALEPPLEVTGSDTGQGGVLYSALLGGYFLIRVQQADGSYKYEYEPDKDEWLWQDVIHRQIGPGYAQAVLYGATSREEFRLSAQWSFEYAMPRVEDLGNGQLRITDIGATSIFVFGLSKLARLSEDSRQNYEETLRGLGEHLLSKVTGDGDITEGTLLAKGQVLQALGHLHRTFGDEKYIEALSRTARFGCDAFSNEDESDRRFFIYYANEALLHLYGVSEDDWVPECVWRMTQQLVDDQWTPENTQDRSRWGGFGHTHDYRPNWQAALWLEGIADALSLAEKMADEDRSALYRERLELGVPFVQTFQWRRGDTDDFPDPPEVIGGYPYLEPGTTGDLAWPLSRTDLAWHGSAMLVKAARLFDTEIFDELPETTAH